MRSRHKVLACQLIALCNGEHPQNVDMLFLDPPYSDPDDILPRETLPYFVSDNLHRRGRRYQRQPAKLIGLKVVLLS